jgi:hypothetical protein
MIQPVNVVLSTVEKVNGLKRKHTSEVEWGIRQINNEEGGGSRCDTGVTGWKSESVNNNKCVTVKTHYFILFIE